MAAGPVRDDGALITGFSAWLRGRPVHRLRRPSSGWTNETVMFDVGAPEESLVVRLPGLVESFPDQDLALEAAVLRALRPSPVPVPGVIALETDASWLGAPFVVMEHVDGHVVGDVPALDEWLLRRPVPEQRALHERFIRALAALHAIDCHATGLAARLRAGVDAELAYWPAYIEWASEGAPTRRLVEALEWCRASQPNAGSDGPSALLWGDARLGNVIWSASGEIAACIDWEGASVGPPEMDLGWYLALDALTTHFVGRTVPGFLDRAGIIECYEQASGHTVAHLEWHEVFALVRSLAINECQARLAGRTGTRYPGVAGDDNPALDYVWTMIKSR